jgi:hypothetical protein
MLRLAEVKPNLERTIPIPFIEVNSFYLKNSFPIHFIYSQIAKTISTTGLQINDELLQKYMNVITSDVVRHIVNFQYDIIFRFY